MFGEMKRDGRKPSMSLRGLVKVRGEFFLSVPGAQREKDREESA